MKQKKTVDTEVIGQRRSFVKDALGLGVGSLLAQGVNASPPILKSTKPIVFRFQSTWPTRDIFNEFAQDFAKKVNDMSGGELLIDVYPANSIV